MSAELSRHGPGRLVALAQSLVCPPLGDSRGPSTQLSSPATPRVPIRRGRTALAILLSAAAFPTAASGQVSQDIPAGAIACDTPDADPWVGELRDRVLSENDLALHALDLYGSPVDCVGAVTSEFDGARFGLVRLSFANGAWLQVGTMPPEVSIVTMTAPPGGMDVEVSREALRAYAEAVGLEIDWESPSTTVEDRSRTESFWDPDPGLNASASLIFLDDALVALRVSMAP